MTSIGSDLLTTLFTKACYMWVGRNASTVHLYGRSIEGYNKFMQGSAGKSWRQNIENGYVGKRLSKTTLAPYIFYRKFMAL